MAKRRPKPVHQMTEAQFEAAFPDEEACKAYLVKRRWPNGVYCPRRGAVKVFPVGTMPYKWPRLVPTECQISIGVLTADPLDPVSSNAIHLMHEALAAIA